MVAALSVPSVASTPSRHYSPFPANHSRFSRFSRLTSRFLPQTDGTREAIVIEHQEMGKARKYWLLKTEPREWSWEDQAANGGLSKWDGVKNKQAQKNMKSMRLGDLCFFYHSGTKARRIVGVVSLVREWYEDKDGGAVDVEAVGEMTRPIDLAEMKQDEELKGFELFRQPRLSVVPVEKSTWEKICEMGGGFDGDGGPSGGDDE